MRSNGTSLPAMGTVASKQGLKGFLLTPLFANAGYLIADIAVVSLFGFAFWMLVTRLCTAAEVGLASATVAAVLLLAKLSGLGLGYGLIRFLPSIGGKSNPLINSCFAIAGLTSLAAALVFLTGLNLWSPALLYLRQPVFFGSFMLMTIAYTLFLLIDQTFIARRCAKYVLFKNTAAGLLKVTAAVVLIAFIGSFGIFVSWGLAILVAVAIALFWLLPRVQRGYVPVPAVSKKTLNSLLHFSLGNHVAELLWFAPFMLFPLLVINILGAETNAYFYIAWVIAQMLFAIPVAISYSLFAEGSHEPGLVRANAIKSMVLCLVILVPIIVALIVLGDELLLFFGRSYSESGATLLRILALSAIPLSVNCAGLGVMRVVNNTKGVMVVSASIASLALGSGYLLMTRVGLIGVGLGWVAAQTLVAIIVVLFLYQRRHRLVSAPPGGA